MTMERTATPLEEVDAETLRRMPYQHSQPKEALPELVIPNAIPQEERIWVPQ
jgi:2,4'-dihydroxyacetophenone dioxygenase